MGQYELKGCSFRVDPFAEQSDVRESKQSTKVVALVKLAENLSSVSIPIKNSN